MSHIINCLDLTKESLYKIIVKGISRVSLVDVNKIFCCKNDTDHIMFILMGEVEGEITFNNSSTLFYPGNVVIISKYSEIRIVTENTNAEICIFMINTESKLYPALLSRQGIYSPGGYPSRIPNMLRHLLFDSNTDTPNRIQMAKDGSDIILKLMLDKLSQIGIIFENRIKDKFKILWNTIVNNPERVWNNQDLASYYGVSESYFFKLCKDEYSTSPGKIVWSLKMSLASTMLIEKRDMRINEISLAVGFSDPFAFSTSFKRKYGLSPREYLKMNT